MRSLAVILVASAVVAAALAVTAPRAPGAADSPRPDPVPRVNGMVFVPAGEFVMGSTLDDLRHQADTDEWPQRRVWVDDYYIDVHEVTNAEYKRFVDSLHIEPPPRWVDGNYGVGEDGFPVVSVTWYEARAYAEWAGKRLPTEAEWEKAARGTDGRRFPWGDEFDPHRCNNGDRLMPIMQFPDGVSPYGCFDMAGNAAEWVEDRYAPYPREPGQTLPGDIADRTWPYRGDRRVYRGGSWNSFGRYLRCANREAAPPGKRWMYVGFRCAMDPPWRTRDRRDR